MKLKILGIRDAGTIRNERIVFLVVGDGDLGHFLTAVSTTQENSISSKISDALWLPDKPVNDGDLVVVYTKTGQNRSLENKDKSRSWFFYRGINEPLFSDANKCVVVFELANWSSSTNRTQ